VRSVARHQLRDDQGYAVLSQCDRRVALVLDTGGAALRVDGAQLTEQQQRQLLAVAARGEWPVGRLAAGGDQRAAFASALDREPADVRGAPLEWSALGEEVLAVLLGEVVQVDAGILDQPAGQALSADAAWLVLGHRGVEVACALDRRDPHRVGQESGQARAGDVVVRLGGLVDALTEASLRP
jgi:hypothetical protein